MATQYDPSPEVVPTSDLPQAYNPDVNGANVAHSLHGSYASPTSEAPSYHHGHSPYYQHSQAPVPIKEETTPPTDPSVGGKASSGRKCSCLVISLIVALVIAGCAVIGLAAATGVAMKNANDKETELETLRASAAAFSSSDDEPTATASNASPSATDDETEESDTPDITNGCSAEEDVMTGRSYTSEFYNNSKFTIYCNTNAPRDPVFSLFAGSFHGCIEACNNWNNYNVTKKETCEGVSYVPYWSVIDNAAENSAPGDCYLKPGPQTKGKLEDAPDTHAAVLQ
ncbi:hypothetical protein F66182_3537 [Fusarium sp. NRRL 66182]|nr:hypothetical protein F66182_3537 [Fusarium sp. NRRL 66182]